MIAGSESSVIFGVLGFLGTLGALGSFGVLGFLGTFGVGFMDAFGVGLGSFGAFGFSVDFMRFGVGIMKNWSPRTNTSLRGLFNGFGYCHSISLVCDFCVGNYEF